MCNAVVQDAVCKGDLGVVHPSGTIRQNSECQIGALERRDGNIAQRWREDHVVGNHVILENFLQCGLICGFEHRANRFESLVGGNKDGKVGEVEPSGVGSGQTDVDA